MLRYSLEVVVFLSGACVMVLELTGSRILAPYLGTSIFVWTSLIGVILACLSLGYWLGGRVADRHPRAGVLSLILLGSGLWMAALSLMGGALVEVLIEAIPDIRFSATVASLLLFGVPSILMGMVSPYAVRLKMHSVDRSGRTVGNLYAISTVGSILGTFMAGFVLIVLMPNPAILRLLFVVLVLASFLTSPRGLVPLRAALVFATVVLLLAKPSGFAAAYHSRLVDVNTLYSTAWIFDRDTEVKGESIRTRFLRIGNENSGAMFVEHWGFPYDYMKFLDLARHFRPGFRSGLMIGGGSYTYPIHYLYKYPEAILDVVEIDPKVTELARQYFFLTDDPRLKIFHEDGRVFLNRTERKYDVIFLDAFKSYFYIPHHLVTREAVEAMDGALAPDGVLCANLLGVLEGPGSELLRAIHATFAAVFPQVYLFAVQDPTRGDMSQNVILVALKSPGEPSLESDDPELIPLLERRWTRSLEEGMAELRDDHAPVEHYVRRALPHSRRHVMRSRMGLEDIYKPERVDGGDR